MSYRVNFSVNIYSQGSYSRSSQTRLWRQSFHLHLPAPVEPKLADIMTLLKIFVLVTTDEERFRTIRHVGLKLTLQGTDLNPSL